LIYGAQWPDRETREAAGKASPAKSKAKQMVNESIESVETILRLDVMNDLLKNNEVGTNR